MHVFKFEIAVKKYGGRRPKRACFTNLATSSAQIS